MAIGIDEKCIKMILPNGKTVDILPNVFGEIKKWLQVDNSASEAGGYIVGYKHSNTGNISLEEISHPYPFDIRNRIRFSIKDPKHKFFLLRYKARKSYYMGVWHTHPQTIPEPSDIDWDDWYETLKIDKTACEYIFFIIAGTKKVRVWVGEFQTCKITEIFECEKVGNLYKTEKH